LACEIFGLSRLSADFPQCSHVSSDGRFKAIFVNHLKSPTVLKFRVPVDEVNIQPLELPLKIIIA
jgi:hypothetical protein